MSEKNDSEKVRKRVADLLRLATDEAASDNERDVSFRAMAKALASLDRNVVHALAEVIEKGKVESQDNGATQHWMSEVDRAMELERVGAWARKEQRDADIRAANMAAHELFYAFTDWPIELRQGDIGQAMLSVLFAAHGRTMKALDHDNSREECLGQKMQHFGELLLQRNVVRASDLKDDLSQALDRLFESHGELPGADAIARLLGRRAADVRDEIKRRIEEGYVETVGNGRARRYRAAPLDDNGTPLPTESRPEAGRETATSEVGTRKKARTKQNGKTRPKTGRASKK